MTIQDKIIANFDYKIKKYEEYIDGLQELGCPESVLRQVISVYQQICNDKTAINHVFWSEEKHVKK